MGEFASVGPAGAVPEGTIAGYTIGSRRIAVARSEGTLYAVDDLCTHAMCSLADGELEGATVLCPCHYGRFDLATGAVLDGPPPGPIRVFPVREVDGEIQVGS